MRDSAMPNIVRWRGSCWILTAALLLLWGLPADAAGPAPWETGLQDGATPVKTQLDAFHHVLLIVITAVVVLVLGLLVYVALRFNAKTNPTPSKTTHHTLLEVAWTVVPIIILVVIAVPSFRLLYFLEITPSYDLTIKATGHQWYWEYEYPDNGGFSFNANMIADEDLKAGQKRLLETDNRVVVPVDTNVRVLITAGDVIHSWAMPAFGVKKDAVPGRINEIWMRVEKEGVYYGQCSEICGTNHGFMPITVEAVSKEKFAAWVKQAKLAFAPINGRQLAETDIVIR